MSRRINNRSPDWGDTLRIKHKEWYRIPITGKPLYPSVRHEPDYSIWLAILAAIVESSDDAIGIVQ
jgi:hypothetical protein